MADSLLACFANFPDLRQNPRYAKAMGEIGWTTLGNPGSYLYLRQLGPVGVAKLQRPKHLDLAWLKTIRRRYHLLTTYVEPGLNHPNLGRIGFGSEPFANSATSLVDLTLSRPTLLTSFKPKMRYNIAYAKRKHTLHIVTKEFQSLTPQDLTVFKASRESWSKRKGVMGYEENFLQALLKHFVRSGWILFAYQDKSCVGSLMILKNKQSAIYYSAFAEPLGYSLFAPTLLTWTAMQTAKKAGCTIFDFGGIYDPRYRGMYKKWVGFTKFKEGFSPTVVTYPETRLLLGW